MTARQFIIDELCIKIEKICESGFPYHAFLLEAVAIEFLGKAGEKTCKWDDYLKDGAYFKKGLEMLGKNYSLEKDDLYKDFRNGLAHFFGPKPGIALASIKNEGLDVVKYHLKRDKYARIILVFEVLHTDFKHAAYSLLDKIDENDRENKVNRGFLAV